MKATQFSIGDYRVRWDGAHNWLLERPVTRRNRKTGEEYEDFDIVGYYGDRLQDLCRRLHREELTGKGALNMKGMADLIQLTEARLEKAICAALAEREAA